MIHPHHNDPFTLFHQWMTEAEKNEPHPNAMTLSTVDAKGIPSIRTVLLKGTDDKGFIFYTNLESKKSQDLQNNNHAALCFYWKSLQRQVCIQGQVKKVPKKQVQEYFTTRPRDSQIAAWASQQSQIMDNPKELEHRVQYYTQKFENQNVTCPEHWGGFCVIPKQIEFWIEKPFRLHERFLYSQNVDSWTLHRLFP